MIKTEPAMNVRKNFGEILNEVEYKHDTVIITRAGKESAAIIDIQLFNKIKSMKNRFEKLSSELQGSFADFTDQEKSDLLDEAISHVRQK